MKREMRDQTFCLHMYLMSCIAQRKTGGAHNELTARCVYTGRASSQFHAQWTYLFANLSFHRVFVNTIAVFRMLFWSFAWRKNASASSMSKSRGMIALSLLQQRELQSDVHLWTEPLFLGQEMRCRPIIIIRMIAARITGRSEREREGDPSPLREAV